MLASNATRLVTFTLAHLLAACQELRPPLLELDRVKASKTVLLEESLGLGGIELAISGPRGCTCTAGLSYEEGCQKRLETGRSSFHLPTSAVMCAMGRFKILP